MNKDDIKDFEDIAKDVLKYISKQVHKKLYKRPHSEETRDLECLLNLLQVILSTQLWANGLFRKIYLLDNKLKDTLLNEIITKCDATMEEMHLQRMEELKCGETVH